jgi:hypothetical protein
LSDFEVVFVPSLCCVVDVVLDFPLGSVAEDVLVLFDGSLVFVVLVVGPPGFSVVVVLELDWANAAPLRARQTPSTPAASFDDERIDFPPDELTGVH